MGTPRLSFDKFLQEAQQDTFFVKAGANKDKLKNLLLKAWEGEMSSPYIKNLDMTRSPVAFYTLGSQEAPDTLHLPPGNVSKFIDEGGHAMQFGGQDSETRTSLVDRHNKEVSALGRHNVYGVWAPEGEIPDTDPYADELNWGHTKEGGVFYYPKETPKYNNTQLDSLLTRSWKGLMEEFPHLTDEDLEVMKKDTDAWATHREDAQEYNIDWLPYKDKLPLVTPTNEIPVEFDAHRVKSRELFKRVNALIQGKNKN